MDVPLRLLLVADPSAAAQAVEPLQRHTAVEAALAPTPAVLAAALRSAVWDAVLLVPGGPVADDDAAAALAASPAAPPLIVVTAGGVPPALAAVAALALPPVGVAALPFGLTSLAAARSAERSAATLEVGGDSAPAFVATANATLAAGDRAAAGVAGFADLVPAAPAASILWALLAEEALAAPDPVAAYAYARTGYHRGLDALRRAGWRGQGPIPAGHQPNQGFLRALLALAEAAAAIGEQDEADRCRTFLSDSGTSTQEVSALRSN